MQRHLSNENLIESCLFNRRTEPTTEASSNMQFSCINPSAQIKSVHKTSA